jgi:hypothetical protein
MFLGAAAAAVGVAAAGEAVRQWWSSSKPGDQTPSPSAQAGQPATAASPAIPPDDQRGNEKETKDNKTIRPSAEDIQRLVDEHSDRKGLSLTTKAGNAIVDETQPPGTKATIVGKNVAGHDVIYEDANGDRVGSAEAKAASNVDRAEEAVRRALDKIDTPDIVALSIPSDTDIPSTDGEIERDPSER